MKKRKKILSDHSGMTLVEILTAFFILMLASKAVVSCISGYSRVIEKSRELSAAGTEVERLTGDAEYAAAAEIHLEIGGEEFVESGSYVEETVKDSDRPVTGFWADQAVMEEIFKRRFYPGGSHDGDPAVWNADASYFSDEADDGSRSGADRGSGTCGNDR